MAIRQNTSPKRPIKASRYTFIKVLVLTALGFLLLFIYALLLWLTQDFKTAFTRLDSLLTKQAAVIHDFEDASFIRFLNENAAVKIKESSGSILKEAAIKQTRLTQALQQHWQPLLKKSELSLSPKFSSLASDLRLQLFRAFTLFKMSAQVLLVKLIILVAALPLFFLAMLAGLIDGLNQRAIRTASLGRESTYVFHKTLPLARKMMLFLLFIWLALPLPIAPSFIFVTLSLLLSFVLSLSASRFKKYI